MMEMLHINSSLEKVCQDAIDLFDTDKQLNQAKEEFAELIVAISHYQRKRIERAPVYEEIADAYIMLGQLRLILNNDPLFQEVYRKKLLRFKNVLDERKARND